MHLPACYLAFVLSTADLAVYNIIMHDRVELKIIEGRAKACCSYMQWSSEKARSMRGGTLYRSMITAGASTMKLDG